MIGHCCGVRDACSGRLSAVAEPTLFLLRVIAAGAFQDTAPDRVPLVAAMVYIGEEMGVAVLVYTCGFV